jgi:hypothetical protein
LDLDDCDLGLGSNHRGHHEVLLNPLSREHWGGVDGVGFELSYDAPLGYASDWSFGQTGWSLVPSLPTSFDDYQQVTSHHDLGKQPHGDLPSGDDWFLPWSSSPLSPTFAGERTPWRRWLDPSSTLIAFRYGPPMRSTGTPKRQQTRLEIPHIQLRQLSSRHLPHHCGPQPEPARSRSKELSHTLGV